MMMHTSETNRICRQVSMPVMPGMLISRRTRSYFSEWIRSSVSLPLRASATSYPSVTSVARITRRICGSSSTTRMRPSLMMPIPQAAGRFGESSRFLTPVLNIRNVVAKASENVLVFSIAQLPLDFRQREMDDVVMVNFLARQPFAQVQPNLMQEINLLWRHPRRVRAKIENLFLTGRGKQLERHARPRLRH